MDKSKTIEGIILSRKDVGEADRILSVYSKSEGKIKIIARGTRRLKSKNACHIEPFTVGKYSIVPGRTFYVLTGAESVSLNSKIPESLERYQIATYLCELLNIVGVEGQPMTKTYEAFKDTLEKINNDSIGGIDILLAEFVLLRELGYHGDYHHCKKCGTKLGEQDYYVGDFEGIICNNCATNKPKISKNGLKILRLLEKGEFDKICNIVSINKYKTELGGIITVYLNQVLPKIPKSGLYE